MKKHSGISVAPQDAAPGRNSSNRSSRVLSFFLPILSVIILASPGWAAPLQREFYATDGAAGDSFGYSLALQDKTAVVSAPGATIGGNVAQGAVYVFRYADGTWTQVAKLSADDGAAYDDFGSGVSFDGNTIIVGAPNAVVNGNGGQGAAYIFTLSGGTWRQTQKLLATDGALGNGFGASVAVQGTTALIGAI